MENNRQKTVTYVGAIVIALLLIGMVFTTVSISKGKRNLNAEKQTSEKLLSEKLFVKKDHSCCSLSNNRIRPSNFSRI